MSQLQRPSDLLESSSPILAHIHGEEIEEAQNETESESEGSDSEQEILK